jgi:hypothetical protein
MVLTARQWHPPFCLRQLIPDYTGFFHRLYNHPKFTLKSETYSTSFIYICASDFYKKFRYLRIFQKLHIFGTSYPWYVALLVRRVFEMATFYGLKSRESAMPHPSQHSNLQV